MRHVYKYQHRTFSYAVCVCYDMVRLLYFDRSGILVTEPFRWDQRDSLLHRFIWKIAKLANAGRFEDLGHDPTTMLVSGDARDMFLGLKDDESLPQHVREGFKKATADDYPVYKLEVVSDQPSSDEWFEDMPFPPPKWQFGSPSTGQPQSIPLRELSPRSCQDPQLQPLQPGARSFLVGRPHFAAGELVGRCTRGYFAYDVTDADRTKWRVCFLKDSWRPVVPGRTRPEHLVYQRLRFFGADKGVGTLVCGGDVGGHWDQRTRLLEDCLPQESRPVLRVHYRLVIEEIGIPLEEFDSFPELSAIFVDVIQAHYRAWTLARVLHADISVSNIMIAPPTGDPSPGRRRGMLIDWDLSRLECELDRCRTSKPDRLGTWQFRSALSLLYPWKPYARSDDVESFVHAYLFLVCRFHPTDAAAPLSDLVRALFHTRALVADGVAVGGSAKRALFTAGRSTIRVLRNPALQELLDEIVFQCAESYGGIDFDEMRRRYGFPPKLPPSPKSRQGSSESGVSQARRRAVVFDRDDMPRTRSDGSSARARYLKRKADLDLKAARVANSNTGGSEDSDPCVVQGFLSEGGDLVDLFMKHAVTAVQLVCSDKAADQLVARRHEDVYRPGWNDDRDRDRVVIDSETDPDSSHSILCDASIRSSS
uniref:2-octaprenylphenol hydroxylase ) n=1 Tax=Ganoderma boninense TaxID=34458 RepID=A0A5K1JXP1_9APHY|nr:2-octaprenylphenol hydroxylase (EC (2-polyprenylphenol 6-hydroxylase) [Ganoderma boninense]